MTIPNRILRFLTKLHVQFQQTIPMATAAILTYQSHQPLACAPHNLPVQLTLAASHAAPVQVTFGGVAAPTGQLTVHSVAGLPLTGIV